MIAAIIIEMLDQPLEEILFIMFFIGLFSLIGLYRLIVIFKWIFNRNRPISIDKKVTIKTPNLSAALSFAFPGFGQIYNRQIYKGSIYIILTLLMCYIVYLTFLLLENIDQTVFAILFILIFVFVYIDGIRDAYITAVVINEKIGHTKRGKEDDIETMMKMGRALYNNKNYEAAIDMCTDIISLNPNHRLAYYNRGVVHYKLKNFRRAGNDFISAAKLGHKEAQRILKSKKLSTRILEKLPLEVK